MSRASRARPSPLRPGAKPSAGPPRLQAERRPRRGLDRKRAGPPRWREPCGAAAPPPACCSTASEALHEHASSATRTSLDRTVEGARRAAALAPVPGGWWCGELESNATMIAQHLFWHHVLGLRTPELDRKIANELRARQRDDGTWSIWFEGPADLSTTIEAYVAMKLAGADPGPKARAYIQRHGGVAARRVFTKCFLALLGQLAVAADPADPGRARAAAAVRAVLDLRLLVLGAPDGRVARGRAGAPARAAGGDRPARDRLAAGRRRAPLRRARTRSAAARSASPSAGCATGRRRTAPGAGSSRRGCGRSSCSRRSATASRTRRCAVRSRAGRASRSTRATGCGRRRASRRSGTRRSPCSRFAKPAFPPSDPRAAARRRVAASQEVTRQGRLGDPAARARPGRLGVRVRERPLPGRRRHRRGRARAARCSGSADEAVRRGLDWIGRDAVARRRVGRVRRRQRARSGSTGSRSATSAASPTSRAPTSRPTRSRRSGPTPATSRRGPPALDWLLAEQERDGSWYGRWGVNHVYGTGAALPGARGLRHPAGASCYAPRARVARLRAEGETAGSARTSASYVDRAWRGRGTSPLARRRGRC